MSFGNLGLGLGRLGTGAGSSAPSEGYDVILLIGQSNMKGVRGPIDPVLDATDANVLQLGRAAPDTDTAILAEDPLEHIVPASNTIGPGLTIGKHYAADLSGNRKVLLVPCAEGSTGFVTGDWVQGGTNYNDAVTRCNTAMGLDIGGTNRLKAIHWQQGETDAQNSRTQAQYAADLDAMIADMRADITGASSTTPFIVGQLADPFSTGTATQIKAALADTPNRVAYTAFASATGLSVDVDNTHFLPAGYRGLGDNHYDAYASAVANVPTVPDAPTSLAAAPGNTQIELTWSAPTNNGKSPITDYIVEYKLSASGTWLTFADGTSATTGAVVTGLTNDSAYDFRVSAVNALGTSTPSSTVSSTPTAAFAPDSVANLLLWLDASDSGTVTLNGSDVAQLDDKSTNGYDFVQGTASLQPALSSGGLNGLDCLTFTGAEYLDGSSNAALLSALAGEDVAYSIHVAVQPEDGVTTKVVWYTGTSNLQFHNLQARSGGWRSHIRSASPITDAITNFGAQDNNIHVISIVRTAGTISVWYDGTKVVNGDTANVNSIALDAMFLGAFSAGSNNFIGNVGEFILYTGTTSDSDVESLQTYLGDKWQP